MAHFHAAMEVKLKGDNSPVTQADQESEAVMLAALARLAPGIEVVSEESCRTIGALPIALMCRYRRTPAALLPR